MSLSRSLCNDGQSMGSRLVPLADAHAQPLEAVGGKAATLSLLVRQNFSIPSGFVVPWSILAQPELLSSSLVTAEIYAQLAHLESSDVLCDSRRFACRSSYACEDGEQKSLAGYFHTELNVHRDDLVAAITKVHTISMQRRGNGAASEREAIGGGVLVMRMLDPCMWSGVAFSIDPVTGEDCVVVEAMESSNIERLTRGESSPDASFRVYESQPVDDDTPDYVSKLAAVVRSVSLVMRCAVDVECATDFPPPKRPHHTWHQKTHPPLPWPHSRKFPPAPPPRASYRWAIQGSTVILLQARPITAVSKAGGGGGDDDDDGGLYHFWFGGCAPLWVREAQARTWIGPPFAGAAPFAPASGLQVFVRASDGHMEGWVRETSRDAIQAAMVKLLQQPDGAFEAELQRISDTCATQAPFFEQCANVDVPNLSLVALWAHIYSIMEFFCANFANYLVSEPFVADAVVDHELKSLAGEANQNTLLHTLLRPVEPDLFETEAAAFDALSLDASDAALLEHAHRFPYVAYPLATPAALLQKLRRAKAEIGSGDNDASERLGKRPEARLAELEAVLQTWPQLRQATARVHGLSLLRLRVKNGWAGCGLALMPAFAEIAQRSGVHVDTLIRYYLLDDLQALTIHGTLLPRSELAQRDEGIHFSLTGWEPGACANAGAMQLLFGASAAKAFGALPRLRAGELKGRVACSGEVTGRARIVGTNDGKEYDIEAGDIIVTIMAQPSQHSMLCRCAGIVTDEGGILSHAAIVARELNIPCVVGTGDATRHIPEGAKIRICTNGGIVVLHDSP